MKKNSIVLMMFLLFAAFASTASADQISGPFTASGFGPNESVGYQNALDEMNWILAAFQATLPDDQLASSIIVDSSWDGHVYQITFFVFVCGNNDLPFTSKRAVPVVLSGPHQVQ